MTSQKVFEEVHSFECLQSQHVCNMIRALLIHWGNYKPCCSDSIHEFLSWAHGDGKRIGGLGLSPE